MDKKIVVLRAKTGIQIKGRGMVNVFEVSPKEPQWAAKITLTPGENFLVEMCGETIFISAGDVAHARFEVPGVVAPEKRGPGRPRSEDNAA